VESNGGSLKNVAEIFVLFLCGVQLVLRSGAFTTLDLDEQDMFQCSTFIHLHLPLE